MAYYWHEGTCDSSGLPVHDYMLRSPCGDIMIGRILMDDAGLWDAWLIAEDIRVGHRVSRQVARTAVGEHA